MDTGSSFSAALLPTAKVKTDSRAISVEVDMDSLHVTLADGRVVSAPLEWFPRLRESRHGQPSVIADVQQQKNRLPAISG